MLRQMEMKNKICLKCNNQFTKLYKESVTQWSNKKYCSYQCVADIKRTSVTISCAFCKQPTVIKPYRLLKSTQIHCSYKCNAMNRLWKGGVTQPNEAIRKSTPYKQWRKAVFQRDNYTCVFGGKEHGSKLNADHIKPFAKYPELRLDINNGRTLCVDCHRKTPTYGSKTQTNSEPA